MPFVKTDLKDLYVFEPKFFKDSRGYFFELFNQKLFCDETGIEAAFVQDNQPKSSYEILRGLHFQKNDSAQAKLVRVLSDKVLDVVVDLQPS
jgi:dTDP-4-dehydrorhamnose 3,5-epimerase